jgi:hypothetical protein
MATGVRGASALPSGAGNALPLKWLRFDSEVTQVVGLLDEVGRNVAKREVGSL